MTNLTKSCIKWIEEYFAATNKCNAIIGISGGKDSTVVAALCKEAIGASRVVGVMMPNGEQSDIEDSRRIIEFLGIRSCCIDIADAFNSIKGKIYNTDLVDAVLGISEQTKINLAPRIRMTSLYAIAQTLNGRVVGTGNLCERKLGYSTLWGDSVSDLNPIGDLFISEVLAIGDELKLPYDLVHKTPADGLSGLSDEEKLGFSYADVEKVLKSEIKNEKIENRIKSQEWKMNMINVPIFKWH